MPCLLHSSGLPKQYGEPRARWRRLKTCEHVRWILRRKCFRAETSVVFTGRRCGRGAVLYPVVRSRLRASVSAVLVSGHEHAPETHQPAAHVSEQEEDGYTGGAASRPAQVLSEVIKRHFLLLSTRLFQLCWHLCCAGTSKTLKSPQYKYLPMK